MLKDKYYTKVLQLEDQNLVTQMEKIEFRTQKNAWSAQSLLECFAKEYIVIGLFCVDTLIGFSVIYNTKFSTDLLTIGVDPDYQGKKLGFKLLCDTLNIALKNEAKECYLEVRVSNHVAISLYEKLGFKKVGVRKNYYNAIGNEPGEDAYTMVLEDIKNSLISLS